MAEGPRREVHSNDMRTRDIFFVVQRIARSSVGRKKILEVAESVEGTDGSCELIVSLGHEVCFMEWRAEAAGILFERWCDQDWRLFMLQCPFAVEEVEEAILDDRSANSASVLRTLKGLGESRRRG